VLCDDAYQGLYHEADIQRRSLFYDLAGRVDPELILPVKIDGATKELAFFGGRVGFLTFATDEGTGEALNDKATAIARATVSSLPGPSQQVVLRALKDPNIEQEVEVLRATLTERYRALKQALHVLEDSEMGTYPFNSGCFALLRLPSRLNAGELRKQLIEEFSVGLIAIEPVNALRIAYCSMATDSLAPMLDRIQQAVTKGS